MIKSGTYFIVGAVVAMIFPFVLVYFKLEDLAFSAVFPLISILLGGLGIFLHMFSALKNNVLDLSTMMLLLSILSIIYGVSFQRLGVENSKYLILMGMLLIAIWIMVPNKKKKS